MSPSPPPPLAPGPRARPRARLGDASVCSRVAGARSPPLPTVDPCDTHFARGSGAGTSSSQHRERPDQRPRPAKSPRRPRAATGSREAEPLRPTTPGAPSFAAAPGVESRPRVSTTTPGPRTVTGGPCLKREAPRPAPAGSGDASDRPGPRPSARLGGRGPALRPFPVPAEGCEGVGRRRSRVRSGEPAGRRPATTASSAAPTPAGRPPLRATLN